MASSLSVVAAQDPIKAIEEAKKLASANEEQQVFSELGSIVGKKGLDEAIFLYNAIWENIGDHPDKIAELFGAGEIDVSGSERDSLLCTLAGRLAHSEPEVAEEWITKIPQQDQSSAMRGFAAQMAKNDIVGLSEKLASMERNDMWRSGVEVLIENIEEGDPEMAESWRRLLEDSNPHGTN